MNRAAVLLRTERGMSVAEIAGCVGYNSPSKFAAAFRRKMGMTPMDYRNRIQQCMGYFPMEKIFVQSGRNGRGGAENRI